MYSGWAAGALAQRFASDLAIGTAESTRRSAQRAETADHHTERASNQSRHDGILMGRIDRRMAPTRYYPHRVFAHKAALSSAGRGDGECHVHQ